MSLFFPNRLLHYATFYKIIFHVLQDSDNSGSGDIGIPKQKKNKKNKNMTYHTGHAVLLE